ncbi:helix-turn-helix transcriptional regulator [Salmonella enterica]|uniref:Helix-turn-helix transcriptional regulator n=3 Tax=Salmonella enterica I TaxID=59201 RepID=A0A3Y5UQH2_SALTM|nr:helix-turn-helix transcriptional regulator [Salmonella enterica]EAA0971669.1 XRE family transcriptional regulator [Salmonella enterica subsp. enterica]EAA3654454.1 XRE family transcriptional regulator [Salmonella enterica subsp. enterica serovar Saintpaul]EBG7103837.1 helix-turn-helix transcriptional regulator [Salmonella enterica subsp. enterica serovar Weltevreden]EBL6460786.1 helix-turn-helix transcriptional regulator [Salmonella enterica subsp. enterica serovar Heidelberg]EBR0327612.1 X
MSNTIGEKIVLIRKSEYLSRQQLADISGIPYGTLSYYENGRSTPPTDVMMKILQTPQFTKYTLWFMTDQISPESGQIAPALAHFGQDATTSQPSDQKTG